MKKTSEWREALSESINRHVSSAKLKNPKYSLRSLAKKTGIPISTLSDLKNQRNSISREKALALLEKLPMRSEERRFVLLKFGEISAKKRVRIESDARLSFFGSDTYVEALAAFNVTGIGGRISALAEFLGKHRDTVRATLGELMELKLVSKPNADQYELSGLSIASLDGIPNQELREFHSRSLVQANAALAEIPLEKRDITTTTFACSLAQIAEIREEIRASHERIIAIADNQRHKNAVVKLCISFFPIVDKG